MHDPATLRIIARAGRWPRLRYSKQRKNHANFNSPLEVRPVLWIESTHHFANSYARRATQLGQYGFDAFPFRTGGFHAT